MGLNYYQIKRKVLKARKLVIQATSAAGSGHPGGSFSMAEILGCLFYKHLKYDPKNPSWEERDKLILLRDMHHQVFSQTWQQLVTLILKMF